ncbi:MAG TPA: ABC transporter substrate-binding protein [bacterium]|nr:ABC transporter substrate-binding protein [bacterium]
MAKDGRSRTNRVTRRRFLQTVTAAGVGAAASRWFAGPGTGTGTASAAQAMRRGGTLKIAEIGEPLTLDTTATTADLTSTITLPVFEELFAFDSNWRIQPGLAAGSTVSKDGLTYTFTLRSGVPFHNGKTMTADDVVASLNRWGKVSPRGPSVYQHVDSVTGAGNTVTMKLKEPFAPLLAFLALPNGAAAIMPKEIADAAGTQPIKQLVGTGPYKFVEWAPDRYVHLARFDQYAARTEPQNGYAGRRDAVADEIFFYPVSQVATRIAGVQSGDYDIADGINQDAYTQLAKDARVDVGIIPGSFLTFFFNKKQGMMANEKLRQAVAVAMDMQPILQATFGNPALYSVDASIYPKGTVWYTEAGAPLYNVHNVDQAKQLAKEAGYSGQPIRWLTTQQYDYMFKSTVVAAAQLQQAGFKIDMQVMDWASVLDHRNKPADYDIFVTSHGFVPDPALITVFSSAYPGWWDTPTKNTLFSQFTAEPDAKKRVQLWAKLQTLMYQEAPIVRPGAFNLLQLNRKGLPGFRASYWIVPWNVQAAK